MGNTATWALRQAFVESKLKADISEDGQVFCGWICEFERQGPEGEPLSPLQVRAGDYLEAQTILDTWRHSRAQQLMREELLLTMIGRLCKDAKKRGEG